MVLEDVYLYLKGRTSITSLVGGQIYASQAPNDPLVKMPWVILEISSGTRNRITSAKMGNRAYGRITVDTGPAELVLGSSVVEACLVSLENYRGLMTTMTDVNISCSEIRNWAGLGGAHRFQFDFILDYVEPITYP